MRSFADQKTKNDELEEIMSVSVERSKINVTQDIHIQIEPNNQQKFVQVENSDEPTGIQIENLSFSKAALNQNSISNRRPLSQILIDSPKNNSRSFQNLDSQSQAQRRSMNININKQINDSTPEKKSLFLLASPLFQKFQESSLFNEKDKQQDSPQSGKNLQPLNNCFLMFRKTNLVKKFIQNLKKRTEKYIFKCLSKNQFKMIGDKSADYKYFKQKQLIYANEEKFDTKVQRLHKLIDTYLLKSEKIIFQPDSAFSILWDILTTIIWVLIIFYIPIQINLIENDFTDFDKPHEFITVFIILETLVKINKAVFKRGMIITNRQQILQEYIYQEAKYDLIILVFHLISATHISLHFLEYILELRILRVTKTYQDLFQQIDQEQKYKIFRQISSLFLVVLVFINLQASIFIFIGVFKTQKMSELLGSDNLLDTYFAGIYWSTITMTTIGYGDIYPQNTKERIYVSIVCLISCGIFGYSINQIGQIVSEIQEKSESFNQKINALNKLMKSRNINKSLMFQVIKYHEYRHFEEENIEEEGMALVNELPKSMKDRVTYEMNNKIIYSQKLFFLNFSKPFLDQLSLRIKQIKVGPETDIYKPDDLDLRIYFIQRGNVELTFNQNDKIKNFGNLKEGDMFGEIEFFSQSSRKFGAKSTSVAHILYLEYEDFYQCLQSMDRDIESYNMIKDKLLMENDLLPLDKKCESCGKFSHLFLECNHLQYKPNLDKLVYEINKNFPQMREEYQGRSRFRTTNAISGMNQFMSLINMLQQDATMTSSQGKERLEERNSNNQIQRDYSFEDEINEQNDLTSSHSSLTQKKKSLVFDKDVGILNKQQNKKINKMKRLSLVKINERVNYVEENKNQIYSDEKIMERLAISSKVNSDLLQTSQNLNITDNNFGQFASNNGSYSNLPSNQNLPSPRLSSLSQTLENQSIKSKKIKNGIEQRVIKFQAQTQENESQGTFSGFENNQPNSNLISNKYSKLQTLNTETENELLKQDLPYKKQEPLWFLNFDAMKSFKIYFPHNNYEKVIHKYNQKVNAKRKQNLPQRSAKNKFSLFNQEQRKNSTKY
ncbi:hypothetical protein ABPG74_000961 [Tetrahymena malaccensis]